MNDLVVVIMLNYNQNEYTIKCVDSLLMSDYKHFMVMVVDNGSTVNNVNSLVKELPKNKKIIFKRINKNIGYPRGSNFALEEGLKLHPRYFLIMNNDTIIDKSAISELVNTCKEYDHKVRVTGKVYHYDEPNKFQDVGHIFRNKKYLEFRAIGYDEFDVGQFEQIKERDMIDDVFVLQPVELYKNIGGYSTYFWMNAVEKDLSLRAVKNGYKLLYTPRAKLWHKGSISIGGKNMNPKLAYWNMQSSLILRYIYLNKFNFAMYYLKMIKSITSTFVKSVYIKRSKNIDMSHYAKAKFKGLLYFNRWVLIKNKNTGYNPF